MNPAIEGAFADLSRGFLRVMGVTNMTVLLGFTLAAYDLDRVRSFRAADHLDETGRATRADPGQAPYRQLGRGHRASRDPR